MLCGEVNSHFHGISIKMIKELPHAIEKPLVILKSKDNCIVLITELKDYINNPLIVIIKINDKGQIGKIEFLSNKIITLYGKRQIHEYLEREKNKDNIIYLRN